MNQSFQHSNSLIEFLSLRLFPAKLTIKAKAELLTGDKYDAAMAYIEAIDCYEAELSELSETALQQLIADEKEGDEELQREQDQQEENNRFFYDRSARADYFEWTKRETWSIDDATALLLGKDPDVVYWDNVNPLVYKSKFAKRYGDLRQQLKSVRDSGELHKSQTPAAYLHYAKFSGFALPAELEALLAPVRKTEDKPAEPEAPCEQPSGVTEFQRLLEQNRQKLQAPKPDEAEEPAAKADSGSDTIMMMRLERETLLKMLGAVAIGRYGMDPACADMSVTETIVNDFEKVGLSVKPDAAHKLLADAARLVSAQKQAV